MNVESNDANRHTWRGFLRRQNTSAARILLIVGGSKPCATKVLIEQAYRDKRTDVDRYDTRINAFNELQAEFLRRQSFVDTHDSRDWARVSDGAYVRVKHIDDKALQGVGAAVMTTEEGEADGR